MAKNGKKLKEVFTPGGLPSVTYVNRENLGLEKKVQNAIARGFAFIVVTGPTKSGKTVLCKRVLDAEKVVTVEGGQIRSEADFWLHIAHQLRLASESSTSETLTSTTGITTEGGAGIPGLFQGKAGSNHSGSTQNAAVTKYNNVTMRAALDILKKTNTTLLVDDFHYIAQDVQKAVIQSLKSAVFEGLSVLLLAVPHRAFDPTTVENEVEGRFKHITIPQWSLEDLLHIPAKGFPELNAVVERKIQRMICENSFGNPLLVQEICSEFCLKNDLREAAQRARELNSDLLEEAYQDMVESKGFPKFQRLSEGPSKGRVRQLRKMRGGAEEDIFRVVLAAIARLGPKVTTSLSEIRDSIKALIHEESLAPRKAEIISVLHKMAEIAKDSSQGERPMEWIAAEERLVITDPFLMFYLRWAFRDQQLYSRAEHGLV